MLMQEEREQIVEYGKKMSADRLTSGTSGNISIYNAEKGYMAISPSGIGYFDVKPEDVVIMDLDANIVDGDKKPSSEWALHTAMYKTKPECRAVVHTHSMYCTVFATLRQPLRAAHYVIADAGVDEVPCAPYAHTEHRSLRKQLLIQSVTATQFCLLTTVCSLAAEA